MVLEQKEDLMELVAEMTKRALREDNGGRVSAQINLPLNLVPYGWGEWTEGSNYLGLRNQKRAYLSVCRRGHGQMLGFLLQRVNMAPAMLAAEI